MLKSHSFSCKWGNEILVKSYILDLQERKEMRNKFCSVKRKVGKVGEKVLLVTVTITEGPWQAWEMGVGGPRRQVQGAVPEPGQGQAQTQAGWRGAESSPEDKDLWVFVDKKVIITWQCVPTSQKASRVLGCIQSSVGSRAREEILPTPKIMCLDLGSPVQEGLLLEQLQRSTTKVIRGLEHLSYEGELELLSLKKKTLQGALIYVHVTFQFLKGPYIRKMERNIFYHGL